MKDVRILKNKKLLKYSIVVPVYNIEKYIRRCVDSIINQTYENIEIILVDDGSTDNSGIICDEYKKDHRVKVIHKINQGLGEARNSGLEIATGDYIAFFDGDDFVNTDLIKMCNDELVGNNVDIISYDYLDYKNGVIIKHRNINKKRQYFNKEIECYLLDMIYNKNNKKRLHGCVWNKLFNLKFLKKIQFRFVSERIYISEDYYSNLILFKYVKTIINIPNALYYYCYNENSLSHEYNSDRLDKNIFQYKESIKLCKKNNYEAVIEKRLSHQYFSNLLGIFSIILNSNMKKKEKKYRIYSIINNSESNAIIKNISISQCNFKQKMILYFFRIKFNYIIYLLLKIRYNN